MISDRYVDSSLAYQGAGRTLPVDEVSWLSAWATGGLKPDLVVLLDIDPAVGLARVGRPRRGRTGWRPSRSPSTSGSGTRSSTSPPPTPAATGARRDRGRPREIAADGAAERVAVLLPDRRTERGPTGARTTVPAPPPVTEVDRATRWSRRPPTATGRRPTAR